LNLFLFIRIIQSQTDAGLAKNEDLTDVKDAHSNICSLLMTAITFKSWAMAKWLVDRDFNISFCYELNNDSALRRIAPYRWNPNNYPEANRIKDIAYYNGRQMFGHIQQINTQNVGTINYVFNKQGNIIEKNKYALTLQCLCKEGSIPQARAITRPLKQQARA